MKYRYTPPAVFRIKLIGVLGALLLATLGCVFVLWAMHRQERWMREDMEHEARLLAQTIYGDCFRQLTTHSLEEACHANPRLCRQLTAALQINPDWRRIALFGQNKDGDIFYYLDAPDPSEREGAQRGDLFPDAPAPLREAFDSRVITICGPCNTPRGVRSRIFVPVQIPSSPDTAVLCLEFCAQHWRQHLWTAARPPLLFSLIVLGGWIAGFVIWARRRRNRKAIILFSIHWKVLVTIAVGLLVTLIVSWSVCSAMARARKVAFSHFAEAESQPSVDWISNFCRREIVGFAAFFASCDYVNKEEFASYSQPLTQASGRLCWSWSEEIAATNQQAFVEQAAARSGLDPYSIWEYDEERNRVPVPQRDRYYPIVYMAPNRYQDHVLGFDLGSESNRLAAIHEAYASGFITASDPIALLSDTEPGILIVRAVHHPNAPHQPLGFISAGIKLADWLFDSQSLKLDQHPMADLNLWSLQVGREPLWLNTTPAHQTALKPTWPWARPAQSNLQAMRPILVFGKTYAIAAAPTPAFSQLYPRRLIFFIMACGLALTGLTASIVSLLVHRREKLTQLVEEQYQELTGTMRRHRTLARETRAMTWEVDITGLFLNIGDFSEELLGYRSDELEGVLQFVELIPTSHRQAILDRFINIGLQGLPFTNLNYPVTKKSGQTIWVTTNGIPVYNETGEVIGYWGSTVDINARVQAEKALRASEQRYRTLFEGMREGVALFEVIRDEKGQPLDGRFLAINPAFERIIGVKAADVIGRTALEVVPDLGPDRILIYAQVARSGEPAFFERYSPLRDKHLEIGAFRPDPAQVAVVLNDVTERKLAEMDLRESRRQYAALIGNLPGMVYRCPNVRQRTMEFVSEGCRALTGYEPEDLIKDRVVSFDDIIHPNYRETVWAKWQAAIQEKRQFSMEYEIISRQGERKWVWELGEAIHDDDGNIIAQEGFITDITSLKEARVERERLMTAIEQSKDAALITDAQGTIQYLNPAFTHITGFPREDMIGRQAPMLRSKQPDGKAFEAIWQQLKNGIPWNGILTTRVKDGRIITERVSISPVVDEADRITNFVSVSRDITKELEEAKARESLQAQLQQAQKMESIGRLAGGVAHDFNNMLQAILGYTELALEQVAPAEPVYGDLEEIQKVAQRSAALTRQLQLFARRQSVAKDMLCLNTTIDELLPMLHYLSRRDIEVIWRPHQKLPLVRMDSSQLDQLVTNLFVNARDAISEAGLIVMETRPVSVQTTIRNIHDDITPGDYVVLSVADTGSGMTPEVLEHIFEPFFTTKKAGHGVGLGLATVYGIVRQSHGMIQIQSQVNQGTTIEVYLPSYPCEENQPTPRNTSSEVILANSNQETILIVEDVEGLLATTRRMLESLKYRVLATTSSLEALQWLKDQACHVDLLLSDIMMPEMSGPKLVAEALAQNPKLKYLYMSGFPADLIAKEGVPEDTPNFIAKPFTRSEIARKIRAILDQA